MTHHARRYNDGASCTRSMVGTAIELMRFLIPYRVARPYSADHEGAALGMKITMGTSPVHQRSCARSTFRRHRLIHVRSKCAGRDVQEVVVKNRRAKMHDRRRQARLTNLGPAPP